MKKLDDKKMFVVRKYIMAKNVSDAIRKERKTEPHDVWVDDEWKKGNYPLLAKSIGFCAEDGDK